MAVIHDKFVFVHVPKTGGQSVSRALRAIGGIHQPLHVPRKALPFDRPAFGFLRNPWHRMVSLYYFLWQSTPKHLPRVDPAEVKRMGFKRWLLDGKNWLSNEPQPDGRVFTRDTGCYDRATTYPGLDVVAAEKDLPPQQRRPVMWYLDGCDHIGKTESLGADLSRILTDLGVKTPRLPYVNKTRAKPKDWQAEYDSETVAHVAHYFAPDIEAGGYSPPL